MKLEVGAEVWAIRNGKLVLATVTYVTSCGMETELETPGGVRFSSAASECYATHEAAERARFLQAATQQGSMAGMAQQWKRRAKNGRGY